MRALTLALAGAALAIVPIAAGANPVVVVAESYFEGDLAGWELYPGPQEQLTWEGPEGYARFEDTSETTEYARAPSEYLGDWSWMDGTGYLYWQHCLLRLGYNPTIQDYRAVIAGPGGRAVYTEPGPSGVTEWESITAYIYEGVWDVEVGTWTGILAQVDTLLIAIELVENAGSGSEADIDGLDNVVLGAPYSAVPDGELVQPATWGAIKALWSED